MDVIEKYYDLLAKEYDQDRFANSYGKFIDAQERKILDKYLDKNEIAGNLDLATGTGRLLDYAHFGVDFSKEMIQVSTHKYPDKKLQKSSAENLPFSDNKFENVLSFHLMMHLNQDKLEEILTEVHRVVKKDGLFIFDVPSAQRRNLTGYKSDNWHGGFQINSKELEGTLNGKWKIIGQHGICFLPIHRLPFKMRNLFLPVDNMFSSSFLKEYASHLIFVLQKT